MHSHLDISNTATDSLQQLVMDITRCHLARKVLGGAGAALDRSAVRCAPIVLSQLIAEDGPPTDPHRSAEDNAGRWLVPEPWNGDLARAPLLFIGQNPSASFAEDYPRLKEALQDGGGSLMRLRFQERFDKWIQDGVRVKQLPGQDREYAPANRFLGRVRKVAQHLYGPDWDLVPGHDYALTEGVRCKARNALGLDEALGNCAGLYMKRTLYFSGAAVIVCMGAVACRALHLALGKDDDLARTGEVQTREWQIERQGGASNVLVLFLRHPSAFGKVQKLCEGQDREGKDASKKVSHQLDRARRLLAAALQLQETALVM